MPQELVRGLEPKEKEADKPFRLSDLPQELQDMIFDRAYPRVNGLRVKFKSLWKLDEKDKRMENEKYTSPGFPAFKVNEWLVCKKFFLAAARAWFGAQKFDFDPTNPFSNNNSESFMAQAFGLYEKFSSSAHMHMYGLNDVGGYFTIQGLGLCQRIQKLTIEQNWSDFETAKGGYAWQAVVDRKMLEHAVGDVSIKALAGIQSLSVMSSWHVFARTKQQEDLVAANSALLEKVLREHTRQPRPSTKSDGSIEERCPLYPGSQVYNISAAEYDPAKDSEFDDSDFLADDWSDSDEDTRSRGLRKHKKHLEQEHKRKRLAETPKKSKALKTIESNQAKLKIHMDLGGEKRVSYEEMLVVTGDVHDWDPTNLIDIIRDYIATKGLMTSSALDA